MKKLKVGDKVRHRGGFGMDAPTNAKVEGIEVNCRGRRRRKLVGIIRYFVG